MEGRRMSQSFYADTEPPASHVSPEHASSWTRDWRDVYARDLIDSRIVSIKTQTSVEDACDLLLSENISCLAVKADDISEESAVSPYVGLFDFADVNAFLTLAATRHTLLPEELRENPTVAAIVAAARAGHVPVQLVSNLSEKNPLESLEYDANMLSLLHLFGLGHHRVLIRSLTSSSEEYIGIVTDVALLTWLCSYAETHATLQDYLAQSSLQSLNLNINCTVISALAKSTVLDAMRLMSDEGVSSVAVLDDDTARLLSAVSVTDIGKIVVPSQSNQILSTPLHQFISQIKAPDGSVDGVDKYPVYSVVPTNKLAYTIQKLLATNAHRLFITNESSDPSSPVLAPVTSTSAGNLSGIVSIVDILSLFARLANISDVDPTRMQRHRRASSSSWSQSSGSRSNSRSSVARNSPSAGTGGASIGRSSSTRSHHSGRNSSHGDSRPSTETFEWTDAMREKT